MHSGRRIITSAAATTVNSVGTGAGRLSMACGGKVLVLGASGVLGQLIVEILQHDHPNIEVISGSRHARSGHSLEHRYLNLLEPASFAGTLEDIDVLIHAAGPFNHDPVPLIEACLDSATHYIDIAEDLNFIERVQQAAQTRPKTQTCIVPGCSTVPGLVSVLSQDFGGLEGLSSIDVYLNLGSRNPVSNGLMMGLLSPLGAARLLSQQSEHHSGLQSLDALVSAQQAVQWIEAHGYGVRHA